MFSFQQELRNFYKLLSELTWKVNKLEKDFTCSQCNSVDKCLGISNQGDEDKFLNEKGDFIVIPPSLDCDDVKDCIGITPTGEANKFLNEQGDYVTVSGSGFTCSDLSTCSTTNLPEGSRLYYTDARVLAYASTLPVSTFSNDVAYITNAALVPYLTSATAAATYYPLTNPSNYITLSSLSAGTGINYNNLTGVITNSSPDIPVVLTNGTAINITGVYPNFTINNTAPDQIVTLNTTGSGFSVTGTYPSFTLQNTLPDQTVVLTQGGTTTITGTYPNFTISSADQFIGTVTSVAALTLGTTGTDLSSTVANSTTTPVITLNVPTASAINRGVLSTTDWSTFNNKQAALGFTPENVANKATTFGTINNTLYPSVEAVVDYALPIEYQTAMSVVFDDFTGLPSATATQTGQSTYAYASANSGGIGVTSAQYPSSVGVYSISTGNISASGSSNLLGRYIFLGGGRIVLQSRNTLIAASAAAQRFFYRYGLFNSTAEAATTDGVYFRCIDNENSGNFVCVCKSASVETVINTAVAPSLSTMQRLRIEINAAGTSAQFFINGTSMGTTATNLPASNILISHFLSIQKTVGTNERFLHTDYMYQMTEFTTPR